MHIENNSTYTSPLYTRATGKTANEDAEQASTPPPSGSQETAAADTAKAAAVTGVTGSNLSKEMVDQLMKAAQEADTSNTDTEKYDGPLPIGVRHRLDEIASNPEFAEEEANLIGTAGEFPRVLKSLLGTDTDYDKMHSDMAKMEQVREQRAAYYDSLKAQGLPPAEIFAKVLEFNANLPSSYDDTLGWSETGRGNGMSYSEVNKAEFDYLQNLINQGNSATASVKTADSTKAAG